MTARYAVVGNPITHSLSPRIHAAFAAAERQDMRYDAFELAPDRFAEGAAGFFDGGGLGLNVTVPFKEDAWRWVDAHDSAAARCGAVNTIVRREGRMLGCNTDGVGLVQDLRANLGWRLAGARVLIVGAGGAARGIARPLVEAGALLTIANRTLAKARRLGAEFGVSAIHVDAVGGGWNVVINATSAGLDGDGAVIAPQAALGARCYDLLYAVAGGTPFCRWAAAHGARAVSDGLGMLVEQAAVAFRLWRGVAPNTAQVLGLLRGSAA